MPGLDEIVRRMRANPDRGTPCCLCGTAAKDCQISYLLTDMWCCVECRAQGAAATHVAPGPS